MPKYHVAESIEIEASPEEVFDLVVDFNRWTTWSPWLIAEPDAKVTVTGDGTTIGDVYAWFGNVTGEGEVEHRVLERGKRIVDELRFIKPFKSVCEAGFQLAPTAKGTKLTWTMDGKMPFFMFWMIPMMKTFIGMDFRRGLLMIKDLQETGAIHSQCTVNESASVGPIRMAGIAAECSVKDVGISMEKAMQVADQEFKAAGLPMDGEMLAAYTKFKAAKGEFAYIVGYTIPAGTDVPSSSKLTTYDVPQTKAFHVKHVGPYKHLGNGWSVANQLVRFKKMKQAKCAALEIYRNSPCDTSENELDTDIYIPLR